jgi:hypothetical protein
MASSVVVPIYCESCGVAKRTAAGQLAYVAIEWLVAYKKGRRMLCPDCFAGAQTMEQLDELVNGWEDA